MILISSCLDLALVTVASYATTVRLNAMGETAGKHDWGKIPAASVVKIEDESTLSKAPARAKKFRSSIIHT